MLGSQGELPRTSHLNRSLRESQGTPGRLCSKGLSGRESSKVSGLRNILGMDQKPESKWGAEDEAREWARPLVGALNEGGLCPKCDERQINHVCDTTVLNARRTEESGF